MPVVLDSRSGEARSGNAISIGLINNMPDAALKTTERQYFSLLDSVSDGIEVRLSLYTLPGVPRSDTSSRHIAGLYADIDDLWDGQTDGLIVTGREPLASKLTEEPYWESFTRTLAWAEENAQSTIWSCLAAHAAVLHMDGIDRIRREDKFLGIFACGRAVDHPLTAGIPAGFRLPHSRWNGVSEAPLTACGYRVLTRTDDGEIDTFIRQQKKLFIFFQGHPEYESDTLLREYRRDISRYFRGETDKYPLMPQGYFDRSTVKALNALQQRTGSGGGDELLVEISSALASTNIENTWQSSASNIYRNWLLHLRAEKDKASDAVVSGRGFAGTVMDEQLAYNTFGSEPSV